MLASDAPSLPSSCEALKLTSSFLNEKTLPVNDEYVGAKALPSSRLTPLRFACSTLDSVAVSGTPIRVALRSSPSMMTLPRAMGAYSVVVTPSILPILSATDWLSVLPLAIISTL